MVVGGGFGGLACVSALRKLPVRLTLTDRQNYHLFQPLLYQVATAALSPSDVAFPIRRFVSPGWQCAGIARRIDPASARVNLPAFPQDLSARAAASLEVEVRLDARVTGITADRV